MTAGTWITADSSRRTGRVTRRRTTRRARATRQACGTGRVPVVISLRVTSQPEASRIERITTPVSHATTVKGSAGSRSARICVARAALGRSADGGAGCEAAAVGSATTRAAGATTVPTNGPAARRRTAVPMGTASMRINVVTARA